MDIENWNWEDLYGIFLRNIYWNIHERKKFEKHFEENTEEANRLLDIFWKDVLHMGFDFKPALTIREQMGERINALDMSETKKARIQLCIAPCVGSTYFDSFKLLLESLNAEQQLLFMKQLEISNPNSLGKYEDKLKPLCITSLTGEKFQAEENAATQENVKPQDE